MLRNLLLAVSLIIYTSACPAEQTQQPKVSSNAYNDFLTLEATVLVTSWLASEDPLATGNTMLVISPLFLGDGKDFLSACAITCTVMAMGLYNRKLDEHEVEKRDIFRNNVLGWNVFLAGYYVYELFSQNGNRSGPVHTNRALNLNLLALREGGSVQLSVRF